MWWSGFSNNVGEPQTHTAPDCRLTEGVPRYRVASTLGLTLCTRRLGWSCSSLDAKDLTWSLYRPGLGGPTSGNASLGPRFLFSIDLVESNAPGTMYPFGG